MLKVGDKVRILDGSEILCNTFWNDSMDSCAGVISYIIAKDSTYGFHVIYYGTSWVFNKKWLEKVKD